VSDDGVRLERGVLPCLGVDGHELHVGEAGDGGRAARVGQRRLVAVDADDAAAARGEGQGETPAARADVEDRAALEGLVGEQLQEHGADARVRVSR